MQRTAKKYFFIKSESSHIPLNQYYCFNPCSSGKLCEVTSTIQQKLLGVHVLWKCNISWFKSRGWTSSLHACMRVLMFSLTYIVYQLTLKFVENCVPSVGILVTIFSTHCIKYIVMCMYAYTQLFATSTGILWIQSVFVADQFGDEGENVSLILLCTKSRQRENLLN